MGDLTGPSHIGRGWDPLKGALAGYPFGEDGEGFGVSSGLDGQQIEFGFDLIENSTAFETAFGGKFSATAGFAAATVDAGLSIDRRRKSNRHSISAVAFCTVSNMPLLIKTPTLSSAALDLLQLEDKTKFFLKYGSRYVESLHTGGALLVEMLFESAYSEEIEEVTGYLKGKSFTSSGSAEFQNSFKEIIQTLRLQLTAKSRGASLPDPTSREPSAILDWMFQSMSTFPKGVAYGKAPFGLFYELGEYGNIDGGEDIEIVSAAKTKDKLDKALTEARARNNDLEFIKSHADMFLTSGDAVAAKAAAVEKAIEALEDFGRKLVDHPFDPPQPPSIELPELPSVRIYAKPAMIVSALTTASALPIYKKSLSGGNGDVLNADKAGHYGTLAAFSARFEPRIPDLHIEYRPHLSDFNWQNWYADGKPFDRIANIEALIIRLTGTAAKFYDLSIRYYDDAKGWLDGKPDDELGSTGRNGRIEAIGITVKAKDGLANS